MTQYANLGWQGVNAQRNYPLSDTATRVDVDDKILPNGLLVDLHIWCPAVFPPTDPADRGETVFVSSVGITESLVSLTLSVAQGSTFVPLAALSLVKPIVPYRNYQFQTFVDNAAGWVSFGEDANSASNVESYRFDAPEAAPLLPSLATTYPDPGGGVDSVVAGLGTLSGVVGIETSVPDDLEIIPTIRTIDGKTRNAIVFRLNQEVGGPEIFQKYLSLCTNTPDSDTCNRPPIYAINEVNPDCDGQIVIRFVEKTITGLGEMLDVSSADSNRAQLDYGVGLADICKPTTVGFVDSRVDLCDDPCEAFDRELEAPDFGGSSSPVDLECDTLCVAGAGNALLNGTYDVDNEGTC